MFNPFTINNDNHGLSIFNIDPDINFFNSIASLSNHFNSDYYIEDTFNKKVMDNQYGEPTLPLVHLNIRSAPKHLKQFELYLNSLCLKFNIIGLCETWFKQSSVDLYTLENYNHVYKYRHNRTGGGVSLFIKHFIDYEIRDDLSENNELVESLFVEIPNEKSNTLRNVIIGIIYRPPNTDLESFNLYMDNLLCDIKKENKTVYIMGDYNIDLFNYEKHILTSQFLETMYLYGFYPLFNRPTRIKSNTATLIDNIFNNNFNPDDMELFNGIFFTEISDHFLPHFYNM